MYEEEIKTLRNQLELDMDDIMRIQKLNLLRYYLSKNEDANNIVKVEYLEANDNLKYSESLRIAIILSERLNEMIMLNKNDVKLIEELYRILQENYYYLAKYLFNYFAVAMEFGIEKSKQFLAPRTCVLNYINWELTKFYYKDRAVMTISMPQGTGKEQPLSSKILTPNGWITMGEVKVGTKVISASGKPCNVTGVYPKGMKDVYRVTFDDNTYVDCGLEHLWEVKTREDRKKKNNARIITTKDMIKNVIVEGKYKNYSVRLVKPIKLNKKTNQDDLNPYLLGCLIANGSLQEHHLTFSTSDKEIADKINMILPETDILKNYSTKYVYGITKKRDIRNSFGHFTSTDTLKKLKEYGLISKKSDEKFIPKKFLYSDYEDRIELLRGLMDNDGYINKKTGTSCVYITTSEQLCKDILELIRGLGGKASFSIKEGRYKRNDKYIKCKDVYQICFTIEENPFFVSRKKVLHKGTQYNFKKFITKIEKIRQEECQCIMVDDEEHLYVTDGYTLTHNTETGKRFMAFAIGNNPNLPNMMVSYSASIAKEKFYNGIMALYADEMGNFTKIFPEVKLIYKSAETLSLDFRNDDKKTTHSEYTLYCAGFDGSITGRTRAHNILYIDDLVKDIEEASNNDIMDKKWTEFTGTLKKRMQGHCKLLIVGTIFSINDPLSRLIEYYKSKDSKRIKIIKIPGLNENMESNFNYGYGFAITTEMFLEDKDLMDAVSFECLIQQNPIDRDGLLFNEEEFKKFKEYRKDETYERTVAAVDVAWGGGDSLAMPIVDEHKNGDCPLIDVYYSRGTKEETIPQVVAKIIEHHITHVFFEANNGGDMYAEAVKEELKKKGVNDCFIDYDKAPTTKSKLDRILAQQGAIKGSLVSTYRLLIKYRDAIRGNRMYNDFLNELFRFSQSLKKQGKQHDDVPDSLSSLFTNVLKNESTRRGAYSHYSREDLKI